MGEALPFSAIDRYAEQLDDKVRGCIVDTNFLIAILHEAHVFHEDAVYLFRKLVTHKIPLHSTATTRSEFIDFQRRIIITEILMDMLSTETPWRLTTEQKEELRKYRAWLYSESQRSNLPVLTDKKIKECKEVFFPSTRSGKDGWLEICDFYLKEDIHDKTLFITDSQYSTKIKRLKFK